jgi:3-isopropylmalate/(R)-2-methylmalate dehydratase small subunit
MLPVQLTVEECAAIAEAGSCQVDLAAQEVRWQGADGVRTATFDIDPDIKHRLLEGLDDIALTLKQGASIDLYERDRQRQGPVTTLV